MKPTSSGSALWHSELVLLVPALQLSLLLLVPDICDPPDVEVPQQTEALKELVSKLKALSSVKTEYLLAHLLPSESILRQDPAGIYGTLGSYSKDIYRTAVERLALEHKVSQEVICQGALALCSREAVADDPRMRLRSHLGYYLLDEDGIAALLGHLHLASLTRSGISRNIYKSYLFAYLLLTIGLTGIYVLCQSPASIVTSKIGGIVCMGILASSSAGYLVWAAVAYLVAPRPLPRLDFTSGIPDSCTTILAIPSILLSCDHTAALIEVMKEHERMTRDRNVHIVLLTDFPDNQSEISTREQEPFLDLCVALVENLNEMPAYRDRRPFYLLHRAPRYSGTQRSWIGWERKRGKLHDLMSFVVSGDTAFCRTVGDLNRLRSAQYVVVLDDDSQLTPFAVQGLVATHAHPLNHPHLLQDGRRVLRGYGILAPGRVTVLSPHHNGEVGLSQQTVERHLLKDVFGRTLFVGKGCIHIATYMTVMDGVIPDETVLSHDVVESGFVRTGFAAASTFVEMLPSTYPAYMARTHRWIRGDWQNIVWLFFSKPRSMSLFGKFAIVEKLRDSLKAPALFFLLLYGAFDWVTLVWVLALIAGPGTLLSAIPMPHGVALDRSRWSQWLKGRARAYRMHFMLIVTAAHSAAVSLDAILRTVARLLTGRNLLEWETSSALEWNQGILDLARIYQVGIGTVAALMAVALIWRGSGPFMLFLLLALWSGSSLVRRPMR